MTGRGRTQRALLHTSRLRSRTEGCRKIADRRRRAGAPARSIGPCAQEHGRPRSRRRSGETGSMRAGPGSSRPMRRQRDGNWWSSPAGTVIPRAHSELARPPDRPSGCLDRTPAAPPGPPRLKWHPPSVRCSTSHTRRNVAFQPAVSVSSVLSLQAPARGGSARRAPARRAPASMTSALPPERDDDGIAEEHTVTDAQLTSSSLGQHLRPTIERGGIGGRVDLDIVVSSLPYEACVAPRE